MRPRARRSRWPRVAFAALLGASLDAGAVRAAVFTVNDPVDAVDALPGDGTCATAGDTCTLRAAIQEANALAGADEVTLPAGEYPLTLAGTGEQLAALGDLDVGDDMLLAGSGVATTAIDGGDGIRLLEILAPATVTVRDLTLRHGLAGIGEYDGGAVRNAGTLALERVRVESSLAPLLGGGVHNAGASSVLTIVDCTFERNSAAAGGGAALAAAGGTVVVDRSTFDTNFASGSFIMGAIAVTDGADVTVRNSTITDTVGYGLSNLSVGGITRGTLTLRNVTVAQPFLPAIVSDDPAATTIADSILATAGPGCIGGFTSAGHNLLQSASGCTIVGDPTGNVLGVDPFLGPLADHGGLTHTHALATGSPALDAGSPAAPGSGGGACEAGDQRGVARPVGGRCDIGAMEGPTQPCGDHAVDPGEDCDAGRGNAFDCCDQTCRFVTAGTTCRIAVGGCDTAETCDGASVGCPPDGVLAAGAVCRPPADQCDAPETCSGTGFFCPLDVEQPDGTPCGDTCVAGATCTAGTCTGGTLDPTTCVDDHLCYRAHAPGRFTPVTVDLADASHASAATVRGPKALCLAAGVDGGTVLDPTTHEEAYRVAPAERPARQVGLQVTDRFGVRSLDTAALQWLLVPARIGLGGPPPEPPDPEAADHYACYRARVTRGAPAFPRGVQATVADQLENRRYDIKGPRWLCRPATKNGEPIGRPPAHLTCYRTKRARGEPPHQRVAGQLQTATQLGTGRLDTVREEVLCVPALVGS